MNEAETLLRRVFELAGGDRDVFAAGQATRDPFSHIAPDARHSLFGPSGTKETLIGRAAFADFVGRCLGALAAHEDEIIAISPIDEHCALVHARAFRKSVASGEEIRYEWAMLYRVEDGQITYGADMLDPDAQVFWGLCWQLPRSADRAPQARSVVPPPAL